MYDLESIRSQFPALARVHRGHPVAYFDGPGGTQVPTSVVSAMTEYLQHHNANTHWHYPTSLETDAIITNARATFADFLNATPGEIAFGQNMTTLTFHLSRALARQWKAGDTIVVTELDHHANIAPWTEIAKERDLKIRRVKLDLRTGAVHWNDLERALLDKPVMLAIGAASNALGTVTDVTRACELAREAGATTFIDAVHYAPHELIDVRAIGCDFLACSPYKFYGPHLGVLYGRRERFEALDVPKLAPAPDTAPEKMETGTLSHEAIAGAAAAVEFLASLGAGGATRRERLRSAYESLRAHEHALLARLWSGLEPMKAIRIHGPAVDKPRTPTVSIEVRGHTTQAVAEALAERGVFVSNGDFYAATVVERLALRDGLVRIGCACYTSHAEVDRVIAGIAELCND